MQAYELLLLLQKGVAEGQLPGSSYSDADRKAALSVAQVATDRVLRIEKKMLLEEEEKELLEEGELDAEAERPFTLEIMPDGDNVHLMHALECFLNLGNR